MNKKQTEIGKYQVNLMLPVSSSYFEMKIINIKIIISCFGKSKTDLNVLISRGK